jgi:hypothetical protein
VFSEFSEFSALGVLSVLGVLSILGVLSTWGSQCSRRSRSSQRLAFSALLEFSAFRGVLSAIEQDTPGRCRQNTFIAEFGVTNLYMVSFWGQLVLILVLVANGL